MLTRRAAILALFAMPLGYYRAFGAQAGWLTVNLDEWKGITVILAKQTVEIPVADIFAALNGKD